MIAWSRWSERTSGRRIRHLFCIHFTCKDLHLIHEAFEALLESWTRAEAVTYRTRYTSVHQAAPKQDICHERGSTSKPFVTCLLTSSNSSATAGAYVLTKQLYNILLNASCAAHYTCFCAGLAPGLFDVMTFASYLFTLGRTCQCRLTRGSYILPEHVPKEASL